MMLELLWLSMILGVAVLLDFAREVRVELEIDRHFECAFAGFRCAGAGLTASYKCR